MSETNATSAEQLEMLLRDGRISAEDYARLRDALARKPLQSSVPAEKARRLSKSWSDRELGGVCGGIAQYMDVSGTRVRLVFLALLLFTGGTAMAIYLVLYALLPWNEEEQCRIPRFPWAYAAAILALTLAFLALIQWAVPEVIEITAQSGGALPAPFLVLLALVDWLGGAGMAIVPITLLIIIGLGAALSRYERPYRVFLRVLLSFLIVLVTLFVLSFAFLLLTIA